MELRHLRYFIAVAEELNFGRAAKKLHISQPPLSKQIKDLEEEIQATLLERSKWKVELTPAGKAFLHSARLIIDSAEQAAAKAKQIHRGESGHLVIGYISTPMLGVVAPALKRLRTSFPNVRIDFVQSSAVEQVNRLSAGSIDLGLVDGGEQPVSDLSLNSDIVFDLISRDNLMVAALPSDHKYVEEKRISVRQLELEPFVTLKRDSAPAYFDSVMALCAGAGFTPVVVNEADNMAALVALVAAGHGIALLPNSVFRSVKLDIRVSALAEAATVPVNMVSLRSSASPSLKLLKTILVESQPFC